MGDEREGKVEGMAKRLSDEDLAAIKQRAEAATPGPWKTIISGNPAFPYTIKERGVSGPSRHEGFTAPVAVCNHVDYSEHDAAFIAHARSDVPRLIAEVEKLKSELSGLEAMHNDSERDSSALVKEIEALRAERDDLKRGLAEADAAFNDLNAHRIKSLDALHGEIAELKDQAALYKASLAKYELALKNSSSLLDDESRDARCVVEKLQTVIAERDGARAALKILNDTCERWYAEIEALKAFASGPCPHGCAREPRETPCPFHRAALAALEAHAKGAHGKGEAK